MNTINSLFSQFRLAGEKNVDSRGPTWISELTAMIYSPFL
jgi:hypothetical protein